MSISGPYPIIRKALVWAAAMIGLLFLPQMHALAHAAIDQAEAARHASLSLTAPDVGHVHDDGDEHEQRPGHAHDQHAFDHSHDTPYRSEGGPAIPPREVAAWRSASVPYECLGVAFGLERPPRGFDLS